MRVNVEHMLKLAGNDAGGAFRHTLPELAANLKELRDRTRAGDMKALDEFFACYVFSDNQTSSQGKTVESK